MIKLNYVLNREQVTDALIQHMDRRLDHPMWSLLCWGSLLASVLMISWYQSRPTLDSSMVVFHAMVLALLFGRHSLSRALVRQSMQRASWHEAHVCLQFQGDGLHYSLHGQEHHIPRKDVLKLERCPEGFLLHLTTWDLLWLPNSALPNRHTLRAIERWQHLKT